MTKKEKCSYADKYKATQRPTCGCDTCTQKWEDKIRAETLDAERARLAKEFVKRREDEKALWEVDYDPTFAGSASILDWAILKITEGT